MSAPIELAREDDSQAEEPELVLDLESGAVIICPHCGHSFTQPPPSEGD